MSRICIRENVVSAEFRVMKISEYFQRKHYASPFIYYCKEQNLIFVSVDTPDWGQFFVGKETMQILKNDTSNFWCWDFLLLFGFLYLCWRSGIVWERSSKFSHRFLILSVPGNETFIFRCIRFCPWKRYWCLVLFILLTCCVLTKSSVFSIIDKLIFPFKLMMLDVFVKSVCVVIGELL